MKTVVKIAVWEYERGWGSKIDDWMVCEDIDDALAFKREFNSKNTEQSVPDWYMVVKDHPVAMSITEKQYDKLINNNGRLWLSDLK